MTPTFYYNVILTGCSGTVGTQLCKELKKHKFLGREVKIVGIDLFPPPEPGLVDFFRKEDISKLDLLEEYKHYSDELGGDIIGIDAIIHTAASLNLDARKDYLGKTNVAPTGMLARLAEYCSTAEEPAHFIHFSSCSIYDLDYSPPYEEYARLKASNNYEESKINSEKAISEYSRRIQTIIRPGMIYGPYQKSLSSTAICVASLLGKVGLSMSGGPKSNWVHSEDLARAVVHILKKRIGGTYNVAEDKAFPFGDIVDSVVDSLYSGPRLKLPWPTLAVEYGKDVLVKALPVVNAALGGLWKGLLPKSPLVPKVDKGALTFGYKDAIFSNQKIKSVGFKFKHSILDSIGPVAEWYKENGWI